MTLLESLEGWVWGGGDGKLDWVVWMLIGFVEIDFDLSPNVFLETLYVHIDVFRLLLFGWFFKTLAKIVLFNLWELFKCVLCSTGTQVEFGIFTGSHEALPNCIRFLMFRLSSRVLSWEYLLLAFLKHSSFKKLFCKFTLFVLSIEFLIHSFASKNQSCLLLKRVLGNLGFVRYFDAPELLLIAAGLLLIQIPESSLDMVNLLSQMLVLLFRTFSFLLLLLACIVVNVISWSAIVLCLVKKADGRKVHLFFLILFALWISKWSKLNLPKSSWLCLWVLLPLLDDLFNDVFFVFLLDLSYELSAS